MNRALLNRISGGRWLLLLLAACSLSLSAADAPTPAEKRAFDAAVNAFADRFYERAERELNTFANQHPQSGLLAQAALLQAQARIHLSNYVGAVTLLDARRAQAGALAEDYLFWLAEARHQMGEFAAAADGFAALLKEFPKSKWRLEAAWREALARFKAGDVAATVRLLDSESGVFRAAANEQPASEHAVRGRLLLVEARLAQKDVAGALRTVNQVPAARLTPELAWLRQYWLARAQFESGDAELALASATTLAGLATTAGPREFVAETVSLRGNIQQQLGQLEAAQKTFEQNLDPALPRERRRQALIKVVDVSLARNQPSNTVRWLEKFQRDQPQDPSLDVVQVTLSDLRLREALASDAGSTPLAPAARSNLLALARAEALRVLNEHPTSPLLGKAHLNVGLIFAEERNLPESRAAFERALELLPVSEDRAIARFKLGDTLFQLKDHAGAISNYQRLLTQYADVPAVRDSLFDHALYQIVRAAIEVGDLETASGAVAKILAWYPEGFYGDRSLLLVGQALNRRGQPGAARNVFVDFLRRFPESPLAPEVHLAIARTYVQDRDWKAGLGKLDDWLRTYAAHPSLPAAEFDRAWLAYQSGQVTNALALFTSFVARFPTNALAPLAQNWIADHYLRLGDYPNAEKNYQLLYQNTNWSAPGLTYSARLMAGRAALARQGHKEAQDYFAALFNDEGAPPSVAAAALFAWGDARIDEPVTDPARALENYAQAIPAFTRITQKFSSDERVAPAFGRLGDCYLQLGARDPKNYDSALDAYRRCLEHPLAEAAARAQASVGLGLVCERQAALKPAPEQAPLLKQALDHYLNVVYGRTLREGELADPFWVKEAGLRAAALVEAQQQWDQAVRLYERLMEMNPALRPALERRLASARSQVVAPVN
jgi:TolA-binding protein